MSVYSKVGFKLPKKDLNKLVGALKKEGEFIAPIKGEKFIRMEQVNNASEICFDGLSWYSSKRYVFPQKQVLFEFDSNKVKLSQEKFPKRVLFGLRLCDLNSFAKNDKLFLEQKPQNDNYKKYREGLMLVGFWCDDVVDEYCFCSSVNLEHYYDLCLFDRGTYFHIKAGTEKGKNIIESLKLKSEEYEKGLPKCEKELLSLDVGKFSDRSDIWEKAVSDCLSCSNCTSLCPTCLCFDIEDDVNLDMKSGTRILKWDSCMFRDFTLVAGGHHFRDARANRFKHRVFHKMVYFPKKFGELMCTGCGRCIRGCPTKIDWVNLLNDAEVGKNE